MTRRRPPRCARSCAASPVYRHFDLDIRDQPALEAVFAEHAADISLVVHTAAQPSHDWAARDPLLDFEVNATATLRLLDPRERPA